MKSNTTYDRVPNADRSYRDEVAARGGRRDKWNAWSHVAGHVGTATSRAAAEQLLRARGDGGQVQWDLDGAPHDVLAPMESRVDVSDGCVYLIDPSIVTQRKALDALRAAGYATADLERAGTSIRGEQWRVVGVPVADAWRVASLIDADGVAS